MIFNIPKLIEYISSIMTLSEGDLILTGTPDGVGPVKAGQVLTAELIDNENVIMSMKFGVVDRI
jgi:acylpyruvate hydrolase